MPLSSGRVAAVLVAALVLLTGCSWLSADRPAPQAPPERASLRVGVGNPVETAPLRIAVAEGRFAGAGLRVELVELETPQEGLRRLAAGDLDVTFASDVAIFKAAATGTALELQGEAYTSGDNTMALVTLPGSKFTEPSARRAPTIAVDMPDDLGTLTTRSTLATAGLDPARIQFVTRPFGEMTAALSSGAADAAWMVEPYITMAEKELGARVLADCSRGATMNFPMSSYTAGKPFAGANPRTLALFRRILGQAQQYATDPGIVRTALTGFAKIDKTTASLLSFGTYPTSLNGVRLQRVADLMHTSGLIGDRLDVQSLLPRPDLP
jgi:NitT/TauT family transport system substrate-binding protein